MIWPRGCAGINFAGNKDVRLDCGLSRSEPICFYPIIIMKRLASLLTILSLSVIIIMLSAGVALVNCTHRQTTGFAAMMAECAPTGEKACCAAETEGCEGMAMPAMCGQTAAHGSAATPVTCTPQYSAKSCMQTELLRLSPFDTVQPVSYHFQAPATPLLFAWLTPVLPPVTVSDRHLLAWCTAEVHHAPPRTMMQRHCVWRL